MIHTFKKVILSYVLLFHMNTLLAIGRISECINEFIIEIHLNYEHIYWIILVWTVWYISFIITKIVFNLTVLLSISESQVLVEGWCGLILEFWSTALWFHINLVALKSFS